jgi:hypothetical protein
MSGEGGEVPGQKLVDAVDGVIGDAFEYMAQVEFRIEAVELGCAQQSVDRSRAFSDVQMRLFSHHGKILRRFTLQLPA